MGLAGHRQYRPAPGPGHPDRTVRTRHGGHAQRRLRHPGPLDRVLDRHHLGAAGPFGAHGINLAAITAAICTGREAHEEPNKRYIAGIACGLFYLLMGVFGATLASVFAALPRELIAALAGLALFGAISSGLSGAMADDQQREAALITFLVTASGMSFLGLAAAFWGLIFGLVAYFVLGHTRHTPALAQATPSR